MIKCGIYSRLDHKIFPFRKPYFFWWAGPEWSYFGGWKLVGRKWIWNCVITRELNFKYNLYNIQRRVVTTLRREQDGLFSRVRIGNDSTLFQVTTWRRTGNKSLLKSMLTQFTDAYMRHYVSMRHTANYTGHCLSCSRTQVNWQNSGRDRRPIN